MAVKKQKTEEVKGFEMGPILREEKPLVVKFAYLKLTLKHLTPKDVEEATEYAKIDGVKGKEATQDDIKYQESLISKCVVSWSHRDGSPLLLEGKPLKCTGKNFLKVDKVCAGLAKFVYENVQSGDTMYRTISADEIKN